MRQEMFVDIKREIIVKQKHVMMFSQRQMMQPVRHIYQLVIYLQQLHVQQLKQEHVTLIQLQDQMKLRKQKFAILN